jgi:hypothetical protein
MKIFFLVTCALSAFSTYSLFSSDNSYNTSTSIHAQEGKENLITYLNSHGIPLYKMSPFLVSRENAITQLKNTARTHNNKYLKTFIHSLENPKFIFTVRAYKTINTKCKVLVEQYKKDGITLEETEHIVAAAFLFEMVNKAKEEGLLTQSAMP